MLKRAILGVSALALLAGTASAADLAYRYPVKAQAEIIPVQTFTWTGFYIGGNVGWAWASNSLDYQMFAGPLVSYQMGNSNGFIGGFQAGYNYQFVNNVVAGVEADFEFTDIKNKGNILFNGPLNGSSVSQKVDYFGTIRGRLGYAMDRFMPYITGGAAWAKMGHSDGWIDQSDTKWGWTIGAGMEYALTNNWTVKGEYLYASFNDHKTTTLNGSTLKSGVDLNVLKAGVNYKF
ncbi:outer membrane protein [Xanthobacter sp. TB0136]|uniref:outer membrane protein n=1 Tax=Xanthobacter sp. TB0136 TaxID=3459177 RepID=UPI004039CBBC